MERKARHVALAWVLAACLAAMNSAQAQPRNEPAGVGQLLAQAQAGDAGAQHRLGAYFLKQGAFQAAAEWFRRAGEGGEPQALNDLAAMMLDGVGVEARDPAKAFKLFQRAGQAGYAGGYRMAGEIALSGATGTVDRNGGLSLMRRAAEAGDTLAQFRIASLLAGAARTQDDMLEPVAWLQRAAAGGHAVSADLLGMMAVAGLGQAQDFGAARQWFEKSAAAGWVPGKVHLAQILLRGQDASDVARARALLEEAAAAGDPEGRVALFEAVSAPGKAAQARAQDWLRAAASDGYPRAASVLALALQDGRVVPADPEQARFWRARAIAVGEPAAWAQALSGAAR